MQSVIRIGSRESKLAVIQAEIIKETILTQHPDMRVELVTMKTTGDKILDKSLELIGGKGLFVKELDQALLEGKIDISVHSLKDMPMEVPETLPILAYSTRQDPRDVLLYSAEKQGIPAGGVIGTSSRRRTLQLAKLYPECKFCSIRGNVQTRLCKLATEGFDATVLAAAGLNRLQMKIPAARVLSTEEVVPAAGQGILAIQGRAGEDHFYLECVNDPDSQSAAEAERAFVTALDGGCTSPIAAFAEIQGTGLKLTGLYYREDTEQYWTETRIGNRDEAKQLGYSLAMDMKARYGDEEDR